MNAARIVDAAKSYGATAALQGLNLEIAAAAAPAMGVSTLRVLLVESRTEFLRLLRAPAFSVPIISFPVMFYILFALVMGPPDPTGGVARHLLASFSTFGVMAPGLFGLGVSLAIERERGLLELKRALPVPAGVYLGAKLVMAAVFAALVSLVLMILAATAGEVVLEALQCLKLLLVAVLGVGLHTAVVAAEGMLFFVVAQRRLSRVR
ncbi:MAG TPA: ABC transporter permease [Steroidobacteraceae bacterium]|nr:ABC transporter permease [Steroidobacteraceae bacterium]